MLIVISLFLSWTLFVKLISRSLDEKKVYKAWKFYATNEWTLGKKGWIIPSFFATNCQTKITFEIKIFIYVSHVENVVTGYKILFDVLIELRPKIILIDDISKWSLIIRWFKSLWKLWTNIHMTPLKGIANIYSICKIKYWTLVCLWKDRQEIWLYI